jgi:hypothetical protein
MNIIFSINGGMGKSIMATAVCRAIRNQYPDCKLYVITGFTEVFSNISSVDMAFNHGHEHFFYSKYIENQEFKVFANEPYLVTEHIQAKEHLIETWCNMNGIKYNGELPEVTINEREEQFYLNKYHSDKPIMVIQTNGGAPNQEVKYSWARDIPSCVVMSVIKEFSSTYNIYHIRREDQIPYPNTIQIQDTYKGIAWLINRSRKRLLMDSFCQHLSCGLGKKSTVLWVANKPNVFGYEINDNIVCNEETKKPDLRHAFFGKYNIVGALHEFPYNSEAEIFDIDSVIASINNQ